MNSHWLGSYNTRGGIWSEEGCLEVSRPLGSWMKTTASEFLESCTRVRRLPESTAINIWPWILALWSRTLFAGRQSSLLGSNHSQASLPSMESWQIVHGPVSSMGQKSVLFRNDDPVVKQKEQSVVSTRFTSEPAIRTIVFESPLWLMIATKSFHCVLVSLEITQCQDLRVVGKNTVWEALGKFDLQLLSDLILGT